MRSVWVISCITVLAACASDPIGRIQGRGEDEESTVPSKRNAPELPSSDPPLGGRDELDAAAPDIDVAPPDLASPDASAPNPTPTPAPVGTKCQQGDAIEIKGQLTPFAKSACGQLQDALDADFYSLSIPAARTIKLRIAADADAVARLDTPNGNVIVVSNGGTASVGSTAGSAIIRVQSKSGTIQDYRIIAE